MMAGKVEKADKAALLASPDCPVFRFPVFKHVVEAIIEVSTGEMGNKPDAVKLGWLKMRTKETWTKQRYNKALARTMEKLREAVAAAEKNKDG